MLTRCCELPLPAYRLRGWLHYWLDWIRRILRQRRLELIA